MKPRNKLNVAGFTVLELFIVCTVMLVLATVMLPMLRPHACVYRGNCTNNLKQSALAFKCWAIDNQDRFPMQVSTNEAARWN